MKKFIILLPMLSLAVTGYAGQTNQLDLKHTSPPPPSQSKETAAGTLRTNSSKTLFREENSYGGALPELRRRKAQFFRAPPGKANADFQNVSVNPITGRAEGIILFSIGF